MTIITPCGAITNDADCPYCLRMQECREALALLCKGCKREEHCPSGFKRKRTEAGACYGRELKA